MQKTPMEISTGVSFWAFVRAAKRLPKVQFSEPTLPTAEAPQCL
jgi:hypothetical protein